MNIYREHPYWQFFTITAVFWCCLYLLQAAEKPDFVFWTTVLWTVTLVPTFIQCLRQKVGTPVSRVITIIALAYLFVHPAIAVFFPKWVEARKHRQPSVEQVEKFRQSLERDGVDKKEQEILIKMYKGL